MKKRILSMLLAIVMVVSMIGGFAFAAGVEDFSDVKEGKWYYDYVDKVAELGYFIGLPDGTFSPETPVNRGAMVLVLARMAQRFGIDTNVDLNAKGVETPFEDVPENEWYAAAVKWAYDNGITKGVGNDLFMPREPVTREDSCTFISRFLNYVSGKMGETFINNKTHRVFDFMDEANIRDYAVGAVDECMAYGIVEGTTGDETGYFYPRETWKRGEGAKMISILHEVLSNPYEPYYPPVTEYTATLEYVVDGNVVKSETQRSYSNNFTWTVGETIDILGTETYTNAQGTEYAVIGWSKSDTAAVADNVAGDTFGSAAGTVKRYAVLVPVDDYIKLAILDLIADINDYAGKIEGTTVSDGYYTLDVSDHLDFSDSYLDTADNTVYVGVTGTLNSETITELLKISTDYAVALLSYQKELPTEEDVMDIITEVADSVGIDIEGKKLEEIAEDVYADVEEIGNVLFDNFKNYNGGLCIEAVTLMNGSEIVATLDIGTQDKLDAAAAKDLAIVIAKQIWAGLQTQQTSAVELHFAVTLDFAAAYNSQNNDTYTLDVTIALESDMYYYDGTTNTLTFIINEDLQEQYAASVEAIMAAAWGNIDELYMDATGSATGVTDLLKAELVKVLTSMNIAQAEAEAAADAWIAANMVVENPDPNIASLYEFLWTMEGKPVASIAADSVTVGDNTALHNAAEGFYSDKLVEVISNSVNASILGNLVDGCDPAVIDSYLDAWIADNTNPNNPNMFALYNLLYNGEDLTDMKLGDNNALYGLVEYIYAEKLAATINGISISDLPEIVQNYDANIVKGYLDAWKTANTANTDGSLFNFLYNGGMPAAGDKLGINGDLHDLIEYIFDAELKSAISGVTVSDIYDPAIGAMEDMLGKDYVNGKLETALKAWSDANTDETNPNSVYSVLYGGSVITAAPVGVNDALYAVIDTLCGDMAAKITVDALAEAEEQFPNAGPEFNNSKYTIFVETVRLELTNNEYNGLSDAAKAYLLLLCEQKAAEALDLTNVNFDDEGVDNTWIKDLVDGKLNDKLDDVINDPTKPSTEWLGKDQAGRAEKVDNLLTDKLIERINALDPAVKEWLGQDLLSRATKVDGMVTEKVQDAIGNLSADVAEWVGLDQAERAAKIDGLVLETLVNFEYEGTKLVDVIAKAAEIKTIERLSDDITLKVFSDLLKNSSVQNLVVENIGADVAYLVDYIDAIPAGDYSVQIDTAVYDAAALQDLKAAAAAGDAKAVCDELAELLGLIGHISMANMAGGNTIEIIVTVDGTEYQMNFALEIK